jgi:hypothetical protein
LPGRGSIFEMPRQHDNIYRIWRPSNDVCPISERK